jgi:hypothetical protein
MANAGIGNSCGAVPIFDACTPRTITGYARSVISGGALVYASGASNIIASSGASAFTTANLLFTSPASGNLCNGIAMYSAASGAPVVVATEGVFNMVCNAAVVAGNYLMTDGHNSVQPLGSVSAMFAGLCIGKALTEAGSNGYALVYLRC